MARLAGRDTGDTKRLILNEAMALFENHGYSNTSMRMVQTNTNLSKGTLYYHFNNKEELFIACIQKVYDDILTVWEQTLAEKNTSLDKLYAWVELGFKEVKRPLIKTLLEYAREDNIEYNNLHSLLRIELDILQPIIKEGIEKGELKKELNVKDTAITLIHLLTLPDDAKLLGYKTIEEQKQMMFNAFSILLTGIQV